MPVSIKHKNFRRLATKRVNKVNDELRKVGNLASSNYECNADEIGRIFIEIRKAVDSAEGLFQRRIAKPGNFSL